VKALALPQPWASLVIGGELRSEVRAHPTAHRGRVAVHARLAFPAAARLLCTREPLRSALLRALGHARWADLSCGALLGTVELADCRPADDDPAEAAALLRPPRVRWVWEFRRPLPLATPIPHRGRAGLFDVPDDLLSLLGVTHERVSA
jgi:activating signal cointegrator 1